MRLLTAGQAAKLIEKPDGETYSSFSIRRWAIDHSEHLSETASPPVGATRQFTPRDLAVLRHVAELRAKGLYAAAINQRLAETAFPDDIDEDDSDNSASTLEMDALAADLQDDDVQLPAVASTDALTAYRGDNPIASILQAEIDAIRDDMDRMRQDQATAGSAMVYGIVIGVAVVIVAFAVAAFAFGGV